MTDMKTVLWSLAATMVLVGCSQTPAQQQEQPPQAGEVFRCLDGNDNDYLEPGELQHASGCNLDQVVAGRDLPESPKRRAEAMITLMDVDGDERISDREFRAWYNP